MANSKIVKQWFKYAGRDLRAAKALNELGTDYNPIVAFSCQQAVEKAIKGYLVFRGIRPAKTHVIKDLVAMVASHDPQLARKLGHANKLTVFAVTYRYPDAEKRALTAKQVSAAIKIAEKVIEALIEEVEGE